MSGTATQPALQWEMPDFSLVLGGPLFQILRRAHLSGSGLQLLHRRIIVITLIAWLPLLVLSTQRGSSEGVVLPFLTDIETHVRFLVALPALIAAELIVHLRLRPAVQEFVRRDLIATEEIPKFQVAINSLIRWRNSIPIEVGLLLLAAVFGPLVWWRNADLSLPSWFAMPRGGHMNLTAAGNWMAHISIPIFQFMLLRWYFRLFIWTRFLWQVSRLNLRVIAMHPDGAGGLSFLGKSTYAFGPILFAQGSLLAGRIASHVLYEGRSLWSFEVEAIGLVAFFLLFIFGPLTMFTPQLTRAKRIGILEYGRLANRYVAEFEKKWIKEAANHQNELLGSGDIQSLADMGNSYNVVREMYPVPFGVRDLARLAAATAAPLIPLGLTVFSLNELVIRLLKLLF